MKKKKKKKQQGPTVMKNVYLRKVRYNLMLPISPKLQNVKMSNF